MVWFGGLNGELGHRGVGRGQPQLALVRSNHRGGHLHTALKVDTSFQTLPMFFISDVEVALHRFYIEIVKQHHIMTFTKEQAATLG